MTGKGDIQEMDTWKTIIGEDIVLDEEAFKRAADGFESLSEDLQALRRDIEETLTELKKGFDTPAGAKFIQSCKQNLFQPMDDQKLVLDHIAKTLEMSRQAYSSVFREYEALQSEIRQIQK